MPLTIFLLTRSTWRGTAAHLLRGIEKHVEIEVSRQRSWPANPQLLSSQLRRITPHLRASGIDVQFGEKTPGMGSKRIITITQRDPDELPRRLPKEKSDAPDADSRRSHDRDKRRERRTRRGSPSEE